jgi:hypothetical protein
MDIYQQNNCTYIRYYIYQNLFADMIYNKILSEHEINKVKQWLEDKFKSKSNVLNFPIRSDVNGKTEKE